MRIAVCGRIAAPSSLLLLLLFSLINCESSAVIAAGCSIAAELAVGSQHAS